MELLRQPAGPCSLPGCNEPRHAYGYCRTHYRHQKVWGDPNTVYYGGWRGDDVGYQAVHSRMQKALGRADSHDCIFCGKQAKNWAYSYNDPDVKYDPTSGRPFSTNAKCYIPLCVSCHKKLDSLFAKNRVIDEPEGSPRES